MTLYRTATLGLALLGLACGDPSRYERAGETEVSTDDFDDDDDPSTGTGETIEVDVDAIIAQSLAFKTNLVQMTEEREPSSTHFGGVEVLVWGPSEVKGLYNSIDTDDPTQFVTFPEGTLFVKETFNESGAAVGAAVMYKGPEGYYPESLDWFWATLNLETAEVGRVGREPFCVDCHKAAANSDLVVGFSKSL